MHRLGGPGRTPDRCHRCRVARVKQHATIRSQRIADAFVAPVDRDAVFARDGGACGVCGEPVDGSLAYPDPMSATVDHIVPLVAGGTHEPGNVQTCHLRCNLRKGTNHLRSERMAV